MAGLIGVGQDYGAKALSGFIQQSAQQNQIDANNKQLAMQKRANSEKMGVEGGVVGYQSGPTAGKWLSGAGNSSTVMPGLVSSQGSVGSGVMAGSTGADSTAFLSSMAPAAEPVGSGVLASGATSAAAGGAAGGAAGTAGGAAAGSGAASAAASGASGASGAAAGAEGGSWAGPVGAVVGAGLGYLVSRLF